MSLRVIGSDELADALSMEQAVDALEAAFGAERLPITPARDHHDVGAGDLLVMPSWSADGVGVKLVTVNPSNSERGLPLIHGLYVLFSPDTLAPEMLLDGAAVTGLRTAAVSGVATRHLARTDAHSLVLFGAGTQAQAHLAAMRAVRPIEGVVIVSRTRRRAEELAERARDEGLQAETGTPDAVAGCDLVCCCTTSAEPVFDGALLPDGAHVNAVGAYRPTTRELDDRAIAAGPIVVEARAAALGEAGDLLIPLESGVITEDRIVAELSDVVRGRRVRVSEDDITIFKSMGVAFEDLVIAAAARRLMV